MRHFRFWAISVFIVSISYNACSPNKSGEVATKSAAENAPSESVFATNKVVLDFASLWRSETPQAYFEIAGTDSYSADAETSLPSGTALGLLVSRSCLLIGTNLSWLTRPIAAAKLAFEVGAVEHILEKRISLAELVQAAESDACVLGVSNAGEDTVQGPLDGGPTYEPSADLQNPEFRQIGLDPNRRAYLRSSTGPGVVVAVVDSGVNDLADFEGRLLPESGRDFVEGDDLPQDDYGHGTRVASVLAAIGGNGGGIDSFSGSRVKVMAVKVTDRFGRSRVVDVVNGIRYAADKGADIINVSIAGPGKSELYRHALLYAVEKGSFVVLSAGNYALEISDRKFVRPAGYAKDIAGVISVGALAADEDGEPAKIADFSNHGEFVELYAPGTDVHVLNQDGLIKRFTGTSIASPIAAAAAGWIFADGRDLGAIENRIKKERLLRAESLLTGDETQDVLLAQIPFAAELDATANFGPRGRWEEDPVILFNVTESSTSLRFAKLCKEGAPVEVGIQVWQLFSDLANQSLFRAVGPCLRQTVGYSFSEWRTNCQPRVIGGAPGVTVLLDCPTPVASSTQTPSLPK